MPSAPAATFVFVLRRVMYTNVRTIKWRTYDRGHLMRHPAAPGKTCARRNDHNLNESNAHQEQSKTTSSPKSSFGKRLQFKRAVSRHKRFIRTIPEFKQPAQTRPNSRRRACRRRSKSSKPTPSRYAVVQCGALAKLRAHFLFWKLTDRKGLSHQSS